MVDQENVAASAELLSDITTRDLNSIICSSDRDFLILNTNHQVEVNSLKGKKIGLYFSASWHDPCHQFTPKLFEVYDELLPKRNFEIIFISADHDDESFNEYFSKMPWLAIPFSDNDTRDRINKFYNVKEIPHLVILDENARLLTDHGVEMIYNYGAEGFPFTNERIEEIKEEEKTARREQSLRSILVTPSRDYVISADGKMVPVSELEGKTIGLYFFNSIFKDCVAFIPKLIEVYNNLKKNGEYFDIVTIPFDNDEEIFKKWVKTMPWFSLPITDKSCKKLARHFELSLLPTLVIIGPNGKTLHQNVTEAIQEHGADAYPFTPEKFVSLREIEKAKRESQSLESILVLRDHNFVIRKDGVKVLVNDLVGKNILFYFSAHWCGPCRSFLPKLVEAYHKIKAKDDDFEVIFVSSDSDQASFNEFFATMPWLALPFGDERNAALTGLFQIRSIPMVVAIGPSGKTVTTEAKSLVMDHGSDAYPFTDDRVKDLMKETLEKKVAKNDVDEESEQQKTKEGWVCDGDVCYRA